MTWRGYGEVVPSLGAHVFPISRIRMQRCLVLYDIYNDRKKLGELMHTIGETEHETTNFPITMSIICGYVLEPLSSDRAETLTILVNNPARGEDTKR